MTALLEILIEYKVSIWIKKNILMRGSKSDKSYGNGFFYQNGIKTKK